MLTLTKKNPTKNLIATAIMWMSIGSAITSLLVVQDHWLAAMHAGLAALCWPFRMKVRIKKFGSFGAAMKAVAEEGGIRDVELGRKPTDTKLPPDAPDWVRNAHQAFMSALEKEMKIAHRRAAQPFVDQGMMEIEDLPDGDFAVTFKRFDSKGGEAA